jgi:hypothetical protein
MCKEVPDGTDFEDIKKDKAGEGGGGRTRSCTADSRNDVLTGRCERGAVMSAMSRLARVQAENEFFFFGKAQG